jgi:hypothetical protein
MDGLFRVAIVNDEPAAELAVGLLRTEGIRAMWRQTDYPAAIAPLGSAGGIMGPIDILVLPQDAERAAELLADAE